MATTIVSITERRPAKVRARSVAVPISAGTDGQAIGVGVAQEEVGILV